MTPEERRRYNCEAAARNIQISNDLMTGGTGLGIIVALAGKSPQGALVIAGFGVFFYAAGRIEQGVNHCQ